MLDCENHGCDIQISVTETSTEEFVAKAYMTPGPFSKTVFRFEMSRVFVLYGLSRIKKRLMIWLQRTLQRRFLARFPVAPERATNAKLCSLVVMGQASQCIFVCKKKYRGSM